MTESPAERAAGRPWLALYEPGMPADLAAPYENALQMVDAAVAAQPDRTLIRYFDTTLSTAEVDAQSAALAVALATEHGVRPGDRIAAQLQNVPAFILTMIAAWRLGAVFVSVNPMLKERELELILNDSGASVLVTLESLYAGPGHTAAAAAGVKQIVTASELDYAPEPPPALLAGSTRNTQEGTADLTDLIARYAGRRPAPVELAHADIAFLTYTSGTTGPPKGAMNTHRNVVFNAHAYRTWCHLGDGDSVLAGAPLFHITGLIAHVAVGLLVPMPIVLSYRFDPATIGEIVERHRPTFTVMAITAYTALMYDDTVRARDFSSLAKTFSGGAPIPPSTVEKWQAQFGTYIYNAYGLTETTSPSHLGPWGRPAPVDEASGALSVGVPIPSTVVRIVDDDGNDLPVGEIGEIVTSGPQVVPGYWDKPEETANAIPGGHLQTGDVGFMDADGWFYIVDRKKDMINAAGYKVWPREVEDVLNTHPAVREAAVVGVPDEYRGESVKAFVSLKADATVTPAEITAFCRERMAAYKYPREVEILDEVPKTVTGKILRRELRGR